MISLRGHCKTRGVAAVAAVAAVVISPAIQNCAAQDAGSGNHWNVSYHAGAAPIPPGSKINVAIEGQKIVLRTKRGPQFIIPSGEITRVSSNMRGRYGAASRAEAKFADKLSNPDCIGDYNPCVFVVVVATLLIIPSYPIKTTERLVQIVWRDRNLDEEIVLKVHKNDFDPFLAQLEKATAKPWKNLETEWAKVQQELKDAEPNKVEIRLDRKATIAKSDLEPGIYQIVLLEREANRGELYFFPGTEVNTERLAAVTSVEIAPSESGADSSLVAYKQDINAKTTISTIRTLSKTFQFP